MVPLCGIIVFMDNRNDMGRTVTPSNESETMITNYPTNRCSPTMIAYHPTRRYSPASKGLLGGSPSEVAKSTPAIEPHNNPTYLVVDTKTHAVLNTRKSRSQADAEVDRLNAIHGSRRYGVDIVW